MFGRFLTSIQWGMAADKYGRVPVMVIGVISVFVLNLSVVYTFILVSIITRRISEHLHPCFGILHVHSALWHSLCTKIK